MNFTHSSSSLKAIAKMVSLLILLVVYSDLHAKQNLKPKQVKSFKHLVQVLNAKKIRQSRFLVSGTSGEAVFSASAETSGSIGQSETNVQVEGVDEGDSVKADGGFIYRIHAGRVQIVRANPANNMTTVAELEFGTEFNPIELYKQGNQLIVVGSGWYSESASTSVPVLHKDNLTVMPVWTPAGESRTMVRVYDISDRTQPVMQREVAFSGDYLSSRKIDNSFYLIGRKYPNYYLSEVTVANAGLKTAKSSKHGHKLGMTRHSLLPRISDSSKGNGSARRLPLADLYYFPGFVEPDYVIVAGFKLDDLNQEADIKAYLGSGEITYASKQNLYLSAADYNAVSPTEPSYSSPVTHLYKFALSEGSINFSNGGEVPGVPLNSFAMDEHNGYFRIATTVGQWMPSDESGTVQTWNNLYTLDSNMSVTGRLEHLAEGERIYSARFIGDRSYLVTFRQVDPLFVIDLSVPASPKVLGELKIPGFSNYLHPYDENHLIGFGQDTDETDTGVVTSGMKLALFDVTDVANPSQMHSLTIGKQGSYSPLLYDHKALLFKKGRGLLAFPISVTAKKPGEDWPTEVFQGAHVYQLSLENGFQKLAAISHQGPGDLNDWNRYIQRVLTIGDQLYSVSDARIQANNLTDFGLTGFLDFPVDTPPDCILPDVSGSVSAIEIAIDCPILVDPL